MDAAFIASFLLALPLTLLADFARREVRTTENHSGILARAPGGAVVAWLNDGQIGRGATGGRSDNDTIIGNFDLIVRDELRGWPLTTTIVRQPAGLDIDIIAETAPRLDTPRDAGDPHQQAIERTLELEERTEALQARRQGGADVRRQWWAWFPAVGAWWLMLFAAAAISIQALRFASLWLAGKRMERAERRRRENRCAACGYDLTGLEFSEKCPECGAEVW